MNIPDTRADDIDAIMATATLRTTSPDRVCAKASPDAAGYAALPPYIVAWGDDDAEALAELRCAVAYEFARP